MSAVEILGQTEGLRLFESLEEATAFAHDCCAKDLEFKFWPQVEVRRTVAA